MSTILAPLPPAPQSPEQPRTVARLGREPPRTHAGVTDPWTAALAGMSNARTGPASLRDRPVHRPRNACGIDP